MTKPLVSVIIATYNSEKTLPMVLEAIKKQDFQRNKIEILLADGGSKDKTLSIAKNYKCKVINNPRTEPIYGKYLGYIKSRGKYVMYLDHDEVLINKKSINLKVLALQQINLRAKAIAGGNYRSPKGYPFINDYINDFGDPFSFFIYRLSKRDKFFINSMKKRYPISLEKKDFTLFNLSNVRQLPIIELVAGGSMFDAYFLKKYFPDTNIKMELIPHLFYLLHSKYPEILVMKDDPILHYSADTLNKYLKKILWRVKNNIYFVSDLGESGFTGREKFQHPLLRIKKYLFIPYAFTLIFLVFDAIYLIFTRRNVMYILHIPITLYTAFLILYHSILKILGLQPVLKNYDDSKTVVNCC
jgi:glycosyltransferase involved in cell wall biosynthesis